MIRNVVFASLVLVAGVSAQQPSPVTRPGLPPGIPPPPAYPIGQAQPGAPPVTLPVTPTSRPLPAERPERLMAAQQLALTAYPELRAQGLQLRVEEGSTGSTVTIGFAARDRDTVLALSRPREAQLVIEATFDGANTLTRALLRGTLAHTAERRRVQALTTEMSEALEAEGAAFGPAKQAQLLHQLDLKGLTPLAGALAIQRAQFLSGAAPDGLYWEVAATSATGEAVTLGFEPYAGRLVRFTRGGAQ